MAMALAMGNRSPQKDVSSLLLPRWLQTKLRLLVTSYGLLVQGIKKGTNCLLARRVSCTMESESFLVWSKKISVCVQT
jgi:hypothetical protein